MAPEAGDRTSEGRFLPQQRGHACWHDMIDRALDGVPDDEHLIQH